MRGLLALIGDRRRWSPAAGFLAGHSGHSRDRLARLADRHLGRRADAIFIAAVLLLWGLIALAGGC